MPHWFDGARLGLFIHWGHASQRGWELSWPMVGGSPALAECQAATVEDYYSTVPTFRPEANSPRRWLEYAKRAGMRYAVFTTKHHDGFAMYPTRLSEFSIARSAYEGDLVREYVDAAREAGLRVGFYFSLCDWHHPDYPAFTDTDRPYSAGLKPRPTEEQWKRYLDFLFGQIRELLTEYGKIDVLWFDGGWERSAEEWHAQQLRGMIRSLQPEILINDRLPGGGDYETPEQFVPAQPPAQRWETCLTMNESWAYNPSDQRYKPARALVHTLCEVGSRGGNLLLNVGPMGNGSLPPQQIERLETLAQWMDVYGESILDTQPGLEPWQFYGPSTRRGEKIFLHLLMRPYDTVTVRGIPIRRVRSVRDMKSGEALRYTTRCAILDQLFNQDPLGEMVIEVPERLLDPLATVVEVVIREQPCGPAVRG